MQINKLTGIIAGLSFLAGIFLIAPPAHEAGKNSMRKEALLQGHAHHAYDSDGLAHFKWSECIHF
jgi:hypothetical protein